MSENPFQYFKTSHEIIQLGVLMYLLTEHPPICAECLETLAPRSHVAKLTWIEKPGAGQGSHQIDSILLGSPSQNDLTQSRNSVLGDLQRRLHAN